MSSKRPALNGHNDRSFLSAGANAEGTHRFQTFQPVPGKQKKTRRNNIRVYAPCWAGGSIPKTHALSLPFEEQEVWWRWAVPWFCLARRLSTEMVVEPERCLDYRANSLGLQALPLTAGLWLEFTGPVPGKLVKARTVNPKTPVLLTKHRFRPVTCKTTAELEAEELEKIQQ